MKIKDKKRKGFLNWRSLWDEQEMNVTEPLGQGGFRLRFTGREGEIMLMKGSEPIKIATIGQDADSFHLKPNANVSPEIVTALIPLAMRYVEMLEGAVKDRLARAEAAYEQGMEIMGPADDRKRRAKVEFPYREAGSLILFADSLDKALPGSLHVSANDSSSPGYFSIQVSNRAEKGVTSPLFNILLMGNRVETECVNAGEKARTLFVETVLQSMKMARDRISKDPDLAVAVDALLAEDVEKVFDVFRHDSSLSPTQLGSYTRSFDQKPWDHTPKFGEMEVLDIGHDFSIAVTKRDDPRDAYFQGLAFKGNPIATPLGTNGAIPKFAELKTQAMCKACALRPDLFPQVQGAKRKTEKNLEAQKREVREDLDNLILGALAELG